jgi:hypothetical protein
MAGGLTRRLIGLATRTRQGAQLAINNEEQVLSNRDEDKQHQHRKRHFRLCGTKTELFSIATRVCRGRLMPLQIMMRCDDNCSIEQFGKTCVRSAISCWSNITCRPSHHEGRNDAGLRVCPIRVWHTLNDLSQHLFLLWDTENTSLEDPEMRSPLRVPATNLPITLEVRPSELLGVADRVPAFTDLEAAMETSETISLTVPETKTIIQQRHDRKVSLTTGETGELNDPMMGSVHSRTVEEDSKSGRICIFLPTESTAKTSTSDSPNVLIDYTVYRVDNLPVRPDLEVIFAPSAFSSEEDDNIKEKLAFGSSLKPLEENTDSDNVYFNLRFPNAESMEQRKIDLKERAERTSDFLETAKSLTLQLSSRRGSLMSTSSYASSMGSTYDTSIESSTPTNSDRGRRQQRRSSFLAGSKIERFDTSRSSSRHEVGRFKRYSSRRSSPSDAHSHAYDHPQRNSVSPQEQSNLSEAEMQQQQQDLERMRMELGYEDMEVPIKSHSENSRYTQPQQHCHLGTIEVTEQLKRSRRRHGSSRRSSFVAGSKIELYEGGKKSRRNSNLRASM